MQQVLPDEATPTFVTRARSYPILDGAASWIRATFPGFVQEAKDAIEAPVPEEQRRIRDLGREADEPAPN
jgi:hypothetical protein